MAALGRSVRAVSSIYRTPPWGGVEQDDFYNIVVIAEDDEDGAAQWLRPLPGSWSRRPAGSGWCAGARAPWTPTSSPSSCTDIRSISDDPELTLPHPRAAERAFVLVPWAEVDPTAELPGAGPIADLIDGLDTTGITRVGHVH